jgi:hypothetical protein
MRSTFEYNITFADYCAALRRAGLRMMRTTRAPWQLHALSLMSAAAAACATVPLMMLASKHAGPRTNLALLAFAGFLTCVVVLGVSSYVRSRLNLRRSLSDGGPVLGPQRLEIEPGGVRVTSATLESNMSWDSVRGVEDSTDAVLLFLDHAVCVVVPATAFAGKDEREQFVSLIRERCSHKDRPAQLQLMLEHGPMPTGPIGDTPTPPASSTRSSALAGFFSALRRNLRAGAKLVLFRRVRPDDFSVSVEQLIALIAIDVLFMFLHDVVAVGLGGEVNRWGLPGALFCFPLLLLACYVVARLEHDTRLALTLPIAALAAAQYISVAGLLLYSANNLGWVNLSLRPVYFIYYWGPYLWGVLVTVSTVLRLTQRRKVGGVAYVALIAALVLVPEWSIPRASTGPLWQEASEHDSEQGEEQRDRWYGAASENAFYAQPEILRRSLAALTPGRSGVPELYFVGVAGYGSQDVFRKELSVITPLLEQRFGTAGHSINLINNPDTALDSPIATVTSLQRTVAQIGRLMNRDEDVLVMYLTSHGSHDHRFSLDFWPLRLRDLDPPTLKKMLDTSAIRWRIIVISACYSGGFIEPLKDERTLVITAADSDHTSFGCGAESKFTYFGQAYFDEALRGTRSFTDAYQIARRKIEARERAEDLTPSNPQMFVGAQMAVKLKELEARWSRGQ